MAAKGGKGVPKERVRISGTRITGKILDWKGSFGWIQPDQQIAHPEAKLRGGKVYLSQTDVESEIEGIGSQVSFFVYADGTGLGAENCRQHTGGAAYQPAAPAPVFRATPYSRPPAPQLAVPAKGKGAPKGGKGGPAGPRTRVSNAPLIGTIKTWKGPFGWITPLEPISHPQFKGQIYLHSSDCAESAALAEGVQVAFYLYADNQGLGAERCAIGDEPAEGAPSPAATGGGKGKGAPPAGNGKYTRERITSVQMTGEVAEWKGTFGWIAPHETIEHEMASRRGGKVYVSVKDLGGLTSLEPGQLVQFHVFVDPSGLGAEECLPF